ncbi:hypothetical protein [Roseovarius rhodophyticola]|uniref:Argininosuccinate lyase n=1 Tax=Roseovarius rhodophyticola TaxID=3080827 RepID=A0ABZ2TIJ2_9RHOB|nr:hypothetical protein [Roseovarius sp. W115]MDV2929847.1 hypothetical protein [Roseovarius sp. W115]
MRVWIAFAGLLALMACGVDGEPIPPGQEDAPAVDEAEADETVSQNTPQTTTSTSVVLSGGSSGVGAGVATTLNRGNVSVTLGTFF